MVSRFDFNNIDNDKRINKKDQKENNKNTPKGKNFKPAKKTSAKEAAVKAEKERKANTLIFPRKNDFSLKIVIYFVLVIILAYMIFSLYKLVTSGNVSTYQVKPGALAEQNTYTGLILREEEIFTCKSSGYYNYYLKEGEKASLPDLVCSVDGSGKIKEMMANQSEDATTLTKEDLTEVQSEIVKFSKEYNNKDFVDVYDFKDNLDSVSLKMSNLFILDKISALSLSGTTIDKYYCKDYNESGKTGYVVYYYDDMEDLTIDRINSSYFKKDFQYERHFISNNDIVEAGDFAYKLVTSNTWQLVFPIETEKALEYDGKEMKVRFSKDQSVLKGTVKIVDAISPTKNQSIEKLAVVTFNTSVADYLNSRFIDFEISTNENEGFKIPNSAIAEKEFILIPKTVAFDYNQVKNTVCVKTAKYLDDGTKSYVTSEVNVYDIDENDYYVDTQSITKGNTVFANDETTSYTINRSSTLKGVYRINQGYADFKKILILYENDEYSIIDPQNTFLKAYDYIALDADKIKDDQYIYE